MSCITYQNLRQLWKSSSLHEDIFIKSLLYIYLKRICILHSVMLWKKRQLHLSMEVPPTHSAPAISKHQPFNETGTNSASTMDKLALITPQNSEHMQLPAFGCLRTDCANNTRSRNTLGCSKELNINRQRASIAMWNASFVNWNAIRVTQNMIVAVMDLNAKI